MLTDDQLKRERGLVERGLMLFHRAYVNDQLNECLTVLEYMTEIVEARRDLEQKIEEMIGTTVN